MQRILDLKTRFLHSSFFCCCIPVRAGFVLITVLSFLLSGAISVIIWFEVYNSTSQLSPNVRAAFILAGIAESLLCLASALGFIGVVARKQLFVMLCTYFLYVHFVINVGVGAYFLVTVRKSNRQVLVDDCDRVFEGTSINTDCARLMNVSTYVFTAVVAALLLLEFYGVLVATRYVYRLRKQKRDDRSRRLGYFHVLSQPESHARQASDDIELLRNVGDSQLMDDVIDIRPRNYAPVSTYDRDLPPVPPHVLQSSPSNSLSDTTSVRRVRALPPRPNIGSPVVTRAPSHPGGDVRPGGLSNPYDPLSDSSRRPRHADSVDDLNEPYTSTEVSTTAHSALMDHATYMVPVFGRQTASLR